MEINNLITKYCGGAVASSEVGKGLRFREMAKRLRRSYRESRGGK